MKIAGAPMLLVVARIARIAPEHDARGLVVSARQSRALEGGR